MTLGALFAKVAAKAGLNISDAKYAELLASSTALNDEDGNKILGSLLTIEDAKNNGELKTYFRAQALDGVDDEVSAIMKEYNLSTEDIAELKAEKNTRLKVNKLTGKISKLEREKAGATSGEKKELQDKINALNSEKAEIISRGETEKKQLLAEMNNRITGMTIRSILSGKKYANEELPIDVNIETALVLANRKLDSAGAKFVLRNGQLALVQAKDESLDWYSPTNEKLTPDQFLDSVLAENKMLKTSSATPPANQNGNGAGNYVPPVTVPGGAQTVNQELLNSNMENLMNLDKAMKY